MIQIILDGETQPEFLRQQKDESFVAKEIETFYGLKRTQTVALITEWKSKDWISSSGKARSTRYRRNLSSKT